jgi:hypothetical protein
MVEITNEMVKLAALTYDDGAMLRALTAVAPLIVAQEREACAQVAAEKMHMGGLEGWCASKIAAAIRARGETP